MSLVNKISPKIKASLLHALDQRPEGAIGLVPEAYTDPDYYEVEKEILFRRQWQCVGYIDQFKNTGDYIALTLSDVPIIVSKTKSGEIKAVANVCQHRSSTLVEEGAGNKRRFSCPYHAWTYELSGELFSVPLAEGFHGLDKSKCSLPEFKVEIWEGFIFVNLSNDAPSLNEQLKEASKTLAPWKLSEMKVASTFIRRNIRCNWKVAAENGAENYHLLCAHKDSLEPYFPTRTTFQLAKDKAITSSAGIPTEEGQKMVAFDAIPDPEIAGLGSANLIYPHLIFGLFSTSMNWLRIIPTSVNTCDIEITLYCPKSIEIPPEELEEKAKPWLDFLFDLQIEDETICQTTQVGLESGYARPAILSKWDLSSYDFTKWMSEQMYNHLFKQEQKLSTQQV